MNAQFVYSNHADIAVDGWALTLLSHQNLSYASTCQTIGLNTGYFASFTVFLALNSEAFVYVLLRSACKGMLIKHYFLQ